MRKVCLLLFLLSFIGLHEKLKLGRHSCQLAAELKSTFGLVFVYFIVSTKILIYPIYIFIASVNSLIDFFSHIRIWKILISLYRILRFSLNCHRGEFVSLWFIFLKVIVLMCILVIIIIVKLWDRECFTIRITLSLLELII